MFDKLDVEETALRRRLLFRLLRGFSFDRPEFRGEAITETLPGSLRATDFNIA